MSKISIYLTLGLLLLGLCLARNRNINREERLLSLFSVVRFSNDACRTPGINSTTGTCLTASACTAQGGTISGNCASGFGTCCVFTLVGCGGTVTQNCTYVQNTGFPAATTEAATCPYTVEKQHDDICFIRLDFQTYQDAGPDVTATGTCTSDSLTFVPGNNIATPTLCGTLTGQHIYLESGRGGPSSMFTTTFTNPTTTTPTTPVERRYNIKVSQIGCDTQYTPRTGCAQYVTGVSGSVQSYNFAEGMGYHLNNMNYQTCVRQERGYCSIQYSAAPSEFNFNDNKAIVGTFGIRQCNSDYINIPEGHNGNNQCKYRTLSKLAIATSFIRPRTVTRYCGSFLNCIADARFNSPITTGVRPFVIDLVTNNVDAFPAPTADVGFKFNYQQMPC